jgi:hypothetical protein
MDTKSNKKNVLQGILRDTIGGYDSVQKSINKASDKLRTPLPDFKKPFDTVKDLPGVRAPIVADPRVMRPAVASTTPKSELPVSTVPQRIMPSNKSSFSGIKVQTSPLRFRAKKLSTPTFGSIHR